MVQKNWIRKSVYKELFSVKSCLPILIWLLRDNFIYWGRNWRLEARIVKRDAPEEPFFANTHLHYFGKNEEDGYRCWILWSSVFGHWSRWLLMTWRKETALIKRGFFYNPVGESSRPASNPYQLQHLLSQKKITFYPLDPFRQYPSVLFGCVLFFFFFFDSHSFFYFIGQRNTHNTYTDTNTYGWLFWKE